MSDFWSGEGMFALYGAVVGWGLTSLQTLVARRRERRMRATYLAYRVTIALDRFAADCVYACLADVHPLDDKTNPDTFWPLPDPYVEPSDVDWSSIDRRLAFSLLSVPERDRAARLQLEDMVQYDDTIRYLRDRLFSELALEADVLAGRLRKAYKVPGRQEGWLDVSATLEMWSRERSASAASS